MVYNLNSGTSNAQKPYLYANLFSVDSVNCPINHHSLWLKNVVTGVYTSYTGTDITLSGGYFTVSTANTHKQHISIKAMTQAGKFTYTDFYVEVCNHAIALDNANLPASN